MDFTIGCLPSRSKVLVDSALHDLPGGTIVEVVMEGSVSAGEPLRLALDCDSGRLRGSMSTGMTPCAYAGKSLAAGTLCHLDTTKAEVTPVD